MADGMIIIDKPSGWTSMDVCAKLRGILHERRIGHGGTLDPMATGVLPVFAGTATRAVEFAENSRKEYVAGLRLGVATDTQDITGNILETCPVHADAAEVAKILTRFTGELEQIPPMYSALKLHGQKLYTLARKGQTVSRPPRKIVIYELELLERINQQDYRFRCVCSKGTYIRTLCHDIGAALSCGGTLYSLRRTMAAGFREADAVTLETVQEHGAALLRPVDSLFPDMPPLTVSPGKERRIRCGNAVRTDVPDGQYRVYAQSGEFLCLSQAEHGILTSRKNFFRTQFQPT